MRVALACMTMAVFASTAIGQGTVYQKASNLVPGDIVYLHRESGGPIILADDCIAYMDLCKAIKANDSKGIDELTNDGRIRVALDGTSVKVLERHPEMDVTGYEVRIQSGIHKDKAGWIPYHWLYYRREATPSRRR